jgi:hypothetical protein
MWSPRAPLCDEIADLVVHTDADAAGAGPCGPVTDGVGNACCLVR